MAIVLTKSRKTLFKKNNVAYPGFNSLSGSWDEFSTNGLCTFSGTIDIINVPGNPSNVDNRKNRTGWMFGNPVEILVEDDNGNFVSPKILPKLYIKNSRPYNPKTKILTLDVSCILGLLSEYSLDHWKNPEKDPNDTEQPTIDDWWSDWKKKGNTTVSAIISKIFQKLSIEMNAGQTLPSTRVLLPWTPSGSLISACGDLCFKSTIPSQLYSDENGKININQINVSSPSMDLYLKIGRDEEYYEPNGTDSPLSELIVVGEIPEILENSDELTEGDDGFCSYREEEGYDYALGDNSGNSLVLSTESVCEKIIGGAESLIKMVTTIRYERLGLLYPDIINDENYDKKQMVKVLQKTHRQEFDTSEENRLVFEETIIKEPWGKIFGAWYNNHLDWYIDYTLSSTSEGGSISPFADEARYSTAIYQSRKEQKNYFYNQDKTLRRTEQTVWEPISKVLTTFNGDGSFPGFDHQETITEKHTEDWVKYRKNERHSKSDRVTMESKYSSIVESSDTYLREKENAKNPYIPDESSPGVIIWNPNLAAYMIQVDKFERPDTGSPVIGLQWVDKNFFLRRQRLALISDNDNNPQVLSRTGEAASPPTENMPNNEAKDSDEIEPEYKNKIFVDRRTWEFPYPNIYKPPREFVSMGVLDNMGILKKISEILYFMRQGKSFSYEVVMPLNQYWIENDFKPLRRIDVDEPDNRLIYLASGFTIELRETKSLILSQLYWLGFK